MSTADIAQIASAVFTALASLAALLAVRQARAAGKVATDAYEAETQPLITDLSYGLIYEEVDWHEVSGNVTRKKLDRAEITVGAMGPEPVSGATVPIRNVGNGCARIQTVVFVAADGSEASGTVPNPVVPAGEFTRAQLWRTPQEDGILVAEAIGMEYSDFSVIIGYADASHRPREAVRLDIRNGEHPHVTGRRWARDVRELLPRDRDKHAPSRQVESGRK